MPRVKRPLIVNYLSLVLSYKHRKQFECIPELKYAVSIQSRIANAVATKFMFRFVAVSESIRIPMSGKFTAS